jgi:hypothetical protein
LLRQKQKGGGGDPPAAAPPELPDEITVELDAYTPYYVKSCQAKTAAGKWVAIHHVDPDSYGAFIDEGKIAAADEIVKKVVDEYFSKHYHFKHVINGTCRMIIKKNKL